MSGPVGVMVCELLCSSAGCISALLFNRVDARTIEEKKNKSNQRIQVT